MSAKNHPGVYIPPPLIYVAFFFGSFLVQKVWPLDSSWLQSKEAHSIGWIVIVIYFLLIIPAMRRFILSKNTLITIKPANSLQTSGIYAFSRNPMYLSLLFLYTGLAIFLGNWWTFILLPLLIVAIQIFVIKKEEEYLHRAFGAQYSEYRKKVRRWI
jgi:protein-S-isoprenylcysteine O-methyltransferase Ste14